MIKSLFFNLITKLRTKRAYFAQLTTTKAKIVFIILPPMMPAIAIARIIPGKESIISAKRIKISSILPPK